MVKKVTKTSTKEAMYEAYQESLEEIKKQKALVSDLRAEQKKLEAEIKEKNASEAVSASFISPEWVQKFNDLKETIAQKEAQLKELFGIEAQADSLAALINTHNVMQEKLQVEATEAAKIRKAEADAQIAEISQQIKDATAQLAKVKKELDADEKQYKKDLDTARKREAEEFKYNLDRSRSLENDKWNDEKAAREKVMKDQEDELAERIAEVTKREEKMDELEAKVAQIPDLKETAFTEGKTAGKKEADTSHAFEKKSIEKQAEYDKGLLQEKVESLTKQITEKDARIKELEIKLDNAYTRNQELATAVAQNPSTHTVVEKVDGKK